MYRLGYGLSHQELTAFLGDRSYRITCDPTGAKPWQEALIRTLMHLLRAPRWAFGENFNLKIFKAP